MTPQEAKVLLKKYLDGSCSDEERALVESWHLDELRRAENFPSLTKLTKVHEVMRGTVLAHVEKQGRVAKLRGWLPYAAAMLIGLSIGSAIYWNAATDETEQTTQFTGDVPPGGNRAILTFADGRTVELNENKQGIVIGDSVRYDDGTLLSTARSAAVKSETEQLMLATPRGGQYQIALPDGTRVWLNAASTLKHPSRFDDEERVVELEGEAYFEVSEQWSVVGDEAGKETSRKRVPFLVKTSAQTVEVLGTEFNVSAYADESETKTTLVEGSVRVAATTKNRLPVMIKPGQQAVLYGENTTVLDVDVSQFTAWKEGFFYFDGMAPQAALTQLERWYDIQVVYQGKIPTVRFFGMLDRKDNLSAALAILKESGLEFKLMHSDEVDRLIVVGE